MKLPYKKSLGDLAKEEQTIKIKKKNKYLKTDTFSPKAFFNMAKQYNVAGKALLPLETKVEYPLYFLFVHALEMLFKSYISLHQNKVPATHSLKELLSECVKYGLVIRFETGDIINTLESENELHGFRYFNTKPTIRPDMSDLSSAVDEISLLISKDIDVLPNSTVAVALKLKVKRQSAGKITMSINPVTTHP